MSRQDDALTTDLVLVKIKRAQAYLIEVKTLQQAKEVIALAAAAEVYARRINASIETTNYAAEIRLRAERKLGEILNTNPVAKGTRGTLRGKESSGSTKLAPPEDDAPTIASVGVTKKESSRAKDLAELSEQEFEQTLSVAVDAKKELNHNRVVKYAHEKRQRETRQAKRIQSAKNISLDTRIIVGDFRDHADRVADGSLSLIFTDPPYDREASAMLLDLAKFAEKKLAEGGSLICYVGQTQLPDALDALRLHLRYWWTIACVHAGGATVMREYGINAGWKAVLWFVKTTRDNNSIMVSDVMSGGEEKAQHDWQQAQSEAEYWIEKLCPPDGLVCDPFLGSGTTAAAARKLNRQWIAFEIDPTTAGIANSRVAQ